MKKDLTKISNRLKREIRFKLTRKKFFTNEVHNGFIIGNRIVPYQEGIKVHLSDLGGLYTITRFKSTHNKVEITCDSWQKQGIPNRWVCTNKIRPAGMKAQVYNFWNEMVHYPFQQNNVLPDGSIKFIA